jgi:hypothetical protein
VVAHLVKRPGGARGAMVEAMRMPGFAEEFENAGAWLEPHDDGNEYPRFITREAEGAAWKLVEAAVGPAAQDSEPSVTLVSRRRSRSHRGRRKGEVSIFEASLAAKIYIQDRAEYDARNDSGAYAVHKLYSAERKFGSTRLSRPMVGHLLVAIRAGWLPWDARKGQLRISDEFRTSEGTFVIPRPESLS